MCTLPAESTNNLEAVRRERDEHARKHQELLQDYNSPCRRSRSPLWTSRGKTSSLCERMWNTFTTKFNKDHNLEMPGDAKQPEQLKVFSTKVSQDIFKMFGGDKDFNHKKDMPIHGYLHVNKSDN
jgi:hypothetical protein